MGGDARPGFLNSGSRKQAEGEVALSPGMQDFLGKRYCPRVHTNQRDGGRGAGARLFVFIREQTQFSLPSDSHDCTTVAV